MSETFLTLAVKTDQYPTLYGPKPQPLGASDKKTLYDSPPAQLTRQNLAALPSIHSLTGPFLPLETWKTKTTAFGKPGSSPQPEVQKFIPQPPTSDQSFIIKIRAESILEPIWQERCVSNHPFPSHPPKPCLIVHLGKGAHVPSSLLSLTLFACSLHSSETFSFSFHPITNANSQPKMKEVNYRSPNINHSTGHTIPQQGRRLIA